MIKLSWSCDGVLSPFTVYRSSEPFDKNTLPVPHATNLTLKEIIEDIKINDRYYYIIQNGDVFSDLIDFQGINYLFPIELPIVNPETIDDITGWTVTTGTLVTRSGYFYGIGSSLSFYQDIPIHESTYNLLEEGSFLAQLDWYYGGWYNDADKGSTSLVFLDGSKTALKTKTSPEESLYANADLQFRTMKTSIPKGTRFIRIRCQGTRSSGTNLDAYWSKFKLYLIKPEPSLYDDYVESLAPITWLKLDEPGLYSPVTDYGTESHTCSYQGSTNGITFQQKVLRKGHEGAMGFSVSSNTNARVQFNEKAKMWNITKGSFTWFVWLERTANNNQERLWGDNGDGVNKRVCWSSFQFPNDSRAVHMRYKLNQTQFICIVFDVQNQKYLYYSDGTWIEEVYPGPVTSTSVNTYIQIPATNGYTHYGCRGYMCDFTWFDRALTTEEVEKVYELGKLN